MAVVVQPEDTVPPKVNYQERKVTDRPFAIIYALSYIGFLACGFTIVSKARARYELNGDGERVLASYFVEDAQECCGDDGSGSGPVCYYLDELNGVTNDGRRRLKAGNSKFDGDEGIFDAFIEAPEIIIGTLAATFGIATVWVLLLRFFAKPVVIFVELAKISALIYLGIVVEDVMAKVVMFIAAALHIGYDYWAREKILYAAKIITHSTIALKENPSIFAGAFLVKLLFAGNAALFVLFFAESFNVVEVEKYTYEPNYYDNYNFDESVSGGNYCSFQSPKFIGNMWWYLSISYLWTILYLNHMRLSIISTIVGGWHFQPEDRPSFGTVIKNTCKSCGTIAVSSFIATIAEKIRRMFLERSILTWLNPLTYTLFLPLHILACCFGTCLGTFVSLFSKFSLILHVFTGRGFKGSATHVLKILSRHFKGGVVTELTSKSVLNFGSYAFSVCLALIVFVWIDGRFDCEVVGEIKHFYMWVAYILVMMFSIWYPVLGLYFMIIVNRSLQEWAEEGMQDAILRGQEYDGWNHLWIPVLAACFVGCIVMMMFNLLSGIFLDIIDTLFLCFAIDMDNNVGMDDELASLVKKHPGYTEAEIVSDHHDAEKGNEQSGGAVTALPYNPDATQMD